MWRFIHLSDPQLGSTEDAVRHHRVVRSMMPDVVGCLRRDLSDARPDFALVTGDVAAEPTRDGIFAARDLMDALDIPVYPCLGDMDTALPESRDWFLRAFSANLPSPETYYSFTHKGLHFAVLDAWWQWPDGSLFPYRPPESAEDAEQWAVPPHELAWLEKDLKGHRGEPTVVALHHPAAPVLNGLSSDNPFDDGHLVNGDLLLKLLESFKQVKAVFSGHAQVNSRVKHEDLTLVNTCSLAAYPMEYREVQVHDDHLLLQTHGLSDTVFAERSFLEGNEFVTGRDEDRAFRIEL
ncbi:MAG: hypothetical protein GY851_25620 [bacterium]|nr:hypothetical protein [bacterium]